VRASVEWKQNGPSGDPATTFPEPRRIDRPPGWADDIETLSLLDSFTFPFLLFFSFLRSLVCSVFR
jgi:hypothetical protein